MRFVVIGDGALRARLEQIAASLDLSEDVKFVGSRRNLEDLYPALDIVALTSLNEGTPLTLIEAMANSRPVISTAVGGVTDLLGDPISEDSAKFLTCQRGLSIPPNDAAAFADGLDRLVDDPTLRREIGERGLQFVQSNYSKDRLLEDASTLYSDLLRGRKTSVKAHSNRLESGI